MDHVDQLVGCILSPSTLFQGRVGRIPTSSNVCFFPALSKKIVLLSNLHFFMLPSVLCIFMGFNGFYQFYSPITTYHNKINIDQLFTVPSTLPSHFPSGSNTTQH